MSDDGDNADETPRSDRGPRGRFAPGNGIGPLNGAKGGRPPRAVEAEYLAAVLGEVPLDRWRKIVGRAVADAEAGDKAAREWLSRYLAPPESRTRVAVESAGADRAAAIEAALAEYAGMLDPGAETDSP